MTSSYGNIFPVTGPLWGEITDHRWIPLTKASDAELWCFLGSAPEQTVEQTIKSRWFETPSCSLLRHCNNCRYLTITKHNKGQTMMTSSNGYIFRVTGLCVGNSPAPVNSPHKGQWRGALMITLICVWINGCINNREAGDLRRYCAHYGVTVMPRAWIFNHTCTLTHTLWLMIGCYILNTFMSSDAIWRQNYGSTLIYIYNHSHYSSTIS